MYNTNDFFKNIDSMNIDSLDELLKYCLRRKEEIKTKEKSRLIENFLNAYTELSKAGIDIYCICQDCGNEVWLHKNDFQFF